MFKRIRSKKKKRLMYASTLIILILIILAIYSSYVYSQFQKILITEGYIQMGLEDITTVMDRHIITLKGDCSELSFFISEGQALAIEEGLSNATRFRPMTHDILVDILEGFNIKPIMVKITRLEENTYFAELILQEWNRFLVLDIRPSDAIAIAVRTDTSIYVNEGLVSKVC